MSETLIDSRAPTTSRTITASVAKIPPVIIAAAAALGAYETAPLLVEYFQLNRPLYVTTSDIKPIAPPEVKPASTPALAPVYKQAASPSVVRQVPDEATAPPAIFVNPPRVVEPPRVVTVARRMTVRPLCEAEFFK
jgi:hypothetical protein